MMTPERHGTAFCSLVFRFLIKLKLCLNIYFSCVLCIVIIHSTLVIYNVLNDTKKGEDFGIIYFSGKERFQEGVELMIGRRLPGWLFICWKYLIPVVTSVSIVLGIRKVQFRSDSF